MSVIPLPEGSNAPETIRRLRAIDAEFFGTIFANAGLIGNLDVDGDITLISGGSIKTAPSGQRIEITEADKNKIYFFSGDVDELAPGYIVQSTNGSGSTRTIQFGVLSPDMDPGGVDQHAIASIVVRSGSPDGTTFAPGIVIGQSQAPAGAGLSPEFRVQNAIPMITDGNVRLLANADLQLSASSELGWGSNWDDAIYSPSDGNLRVKIGSQDMVNFGTNITTFYNSDGNESFAIEAFAGVSREVVRLHAGGYLNGPYMQMISDTDSSPEQIQFRSSAGSAILTIDPIDLQVGGSGGSVTKPAILPNASDPDTGIWSSVADRISFSTNGVQRMYIGTTHLWFKSGETGTPAIRNNAVSSVTLPGYSWAGDTDTGLARDSADTMKIVTGGAARLTINNTTLDAPSGVHFSMHGTSGFYTYRNSPTASSGNTAIWFNNSGTYELRRTSSALKYKVDVQEERDIADIELIPTSFGLENDPEDKRLGLIADWLAEQDERLALYDEEGDVDDYHDRGVMAVMAAKINRLEERIKELEG